MKTFFAVILMVLAAAGCSTDSALRAQIAGANIELARHRAEAAALPVLDARIPTPNGDMVIVVHAPAGNNANTQVAMPDDPWARVADRAVGVLGTAGGLWIGGEAAVGLVSATSAGITRALATQPAPTVVTQPPPLVVQPEVVQVPAPEVVQVPDPFVVNPVVVTP